VSFLDPMTGAEHYREARELLNGPCGYGCPHAGCDHDVARIAEAQVHATLALAAATALRDPNTGLPGPDLAEWESAAGAPPAAADDDGVCRPELRCPYCPPPDPTDRGETTTGRQR
jgi:hypothetical protein